MQETFKDIPGYEGKYQVSNLGKVKSLPKKRGFGKGYTCKELILKPSLNMGYPAIVLCNGINKLITIHRLVAITFIPNPKNKKTVNHKNGIKTDNQVDNLEWATQLENNLHSFRKLGRKSGMFGKYGKNHNRSKAVFQFTKNGDLVSQYGSILEAKRKTGICNTNISFACKGKYKSAGGYIWKYV